VDKGTTLVIMNKNDKIQEVQVQINDLNNYKPLDKPTMKETHTKVSRLISELGCNNYINDITKKWLSQTPHPPRIPEFYTLTKVHKPALVGTPIISGCNWPTERITAFVDTLLSLFPHHKHLILKNPQISSTLLRRRGWENELSL